MFRAPRLSLIQVNDRAALLPGLMTLLSLTAAGCGPSGPEPVNPKQVVPVSGIVHVDGEPQPGVKVRLVPIPLPPGGRVTLPTIGRTDEEGNFQLTTYYQNDGAPIGEFGMLFEWDLNPSGDAYDHFQGKYMDRSAPEHKLSVKGDEESIDVGVIELTSP